jgi:hypothetical protein
MGRHSDPSSLGYGDCSPWALSDLCLADLKNKIVFVTEGNDTVLAEQVMPSIEVMVRQVQMQLNRHASLLSCEVFMSPLAHHTRRSICNGVVEGKALYVNTAAEPKTLPISVALHGGITGMIYAGSVVLGPYKVDLIRNDLPRQINRLDELPEERDS